MRSEEQKKKRKIASAIGAGVLAVAIAVTGTYAWQSISQNAKNVIDVDNNPGGRLHDDFNGKNKDVYVENFTDPDENGVPIFIRVRLDEYMEIGPNAGKTNKTPEETANTQPLVAGTDINDVHTWTPHIPEAYVNTCENGSPDTFHKYWNWDMGGDTVFMPTFNKNKDSLKADINGTAEGLDGIRDQGEPYDDYKEYAAGAVKKDLAIYDADDNDVDEGDAALEDTNITTVEEEHTAKATQKAQVITMAEWKAKGMPIGRYWVYDVDGWAYWAEALLPGEATGLLLDGITLNREPDNKAYYGINVVGQFATRGDWGDANSKTGFYADDAGAPPTADALFLLRQAADLLPKVTEVTIAEGENIYVKPSDSLTLHSDVKVINATDDPAEKAVRWSIDPAADETVFKDGVFTATEAMEGKTYHVTATSAYDPTYSAVTNIYVYPSEAVSVDKGKDGKMYVNYGDNTYKEILDNNVLGDYVCAGRDEKIGNEDDAAQIVVLEAPNKTYGSKFIGEEYDYGYWAAGPDGLLGTADDIKVWGDPWPNNISTIQPTDKIADTVTLTAAGNKATIKPGETLQFNASVTLNGNPIERQNVSWSISGSTKPGTKIDGNGLLTVDANEPEDTVLTVKATSKAAPNVSGEKKATVKVNTIPPELEAIETITPGSTATVNIDGIDWYVLAKDGDKALLWTKEMSPVWGANAFGNGNSWVVSKVRAWLNGDFLNSLTTMKDCIQDTTLTTRTQYDASTWETTTDKVFLLSEADLFGQHSAKPTSEPRDYTYQGKQLVTNEALKKCSSSVSTYYWLRSPSTYSYAATLVSAGGINDCGSDTSHYGVRPSLWVKYK